MHVVRQRWDAGEGRSLPAAPAAARQRGAIIVLFALMVPALIALAGLVIDLGRLLAERRAVQAAADAAAWAAASEVLWGTPGNAVAVGQWYAELNGYGASSGATVTVNRPPTSGTYVGQADYVQIVVRRPLTLTLAQIVHPDPITITVSATAGPSPGPAPYGLLALNSRAGGIDLSAPVTVRNSSAASNYQITARGIGSLTADVLVSAHGSIAAAGGGLVHGTRGTQANVPVIPDPFKDLPEPPLPSTTWNGLDVTGSGGMITIQPGRWTGSIRVRGTYNQVTLAPGLYYFDNAANLDILGVGNVVVGNGVLIYLRPGSTISLSGGADLALTAPTSAPYAGGVVGLVVFSARGNTTQLDLTGQAATRLTGTVYAPDAPLRLAGTAAATVGQGQLIADSLTFDGSSALTITYDRSLVARQDRPVLLE